VIKNTLLIGEILYQLYLGVKRGESVPKSLDPNDLIRNLTNNESISSNNINHNTKQRDAIRFLDSALPSLLKINETATKSELSRGIFQAKKLLLAAEILNYSLLKHAAVFVAERAIKVGKKYSVLEVVFQANKILYTKRRFFKNKKKIVASYQEFETYLEYYKIERSIERDYLEMVIRDDQSASHNIETAKLCGEILEKYRTYFHKIPSVLFHDIFFSLQYLKASHEKSMGEVYQIACSKTEYFLNLDFKFIPGLNHGYSLQIIYLIQIKAYEKGETVLKEANEVLPKNTLGSFNFLRSVTVLKLHKGDYEEAISLVFKILNHKKFNLMSPVFKRDWFLYEAYVNLLIETGHATYEGRRRRFSIQRFINDLPGYSKDKKAMNIPILIAQMLFFITRKQYNKAIDRIESLGKYTSRYLRNDETFRSMCFIKMILEIPKWSFNQLRVERATADLYQRLLASEMDLINQPFEIEVIPYETLWEIIMNELRPDHNYVPKKSRGTSTEKRGLRQAS